MDNKTKICSLNITCGECGITKDLLEATTKLYKEKYPITTADFWGLEYYPDIYETPEDFKKVKFVFYFENESDLVLKTALISSLLASEYCSKFEGEKIDFIIDGVRISDLIPANAKYLVPGVGLVSEDALCELGYTFDEEKKIWFSNEKIEGIPPTQKG